MRSKLPFSIILLAIHYLLLNTIIFGAATADHGAAVEPSRKLAGSNAGGVKLRVIHVYGDSSPYKPPNRTWESLRRQTFNAVTKSGIPVASGARIRRGNYIVQIDFGCPGKRFYAAIDTGSDVTWIPCRPCLNCDVQSNAPFNPSTSSSYRALTCDSAQCKQLDPLFNPSSCNNSSSAPNSLCNFGQVYGDQSLFIANLAAETLSLGSDGIPGFVFGCVHLEIGLLEPGLVGLGRGAFSLVSQTAQLYHKTFSYCLPTQQSSQFSGSLILGKEALSATGLKFTKLLTNPANPSFYYVGLKGISVGGELLSGIPPETFVLNTTDGGGTIIDSGTVITRLAPPAYNALKHAFQKGISLHPLQNTSDYDPLDTCYNISSSENGTIDAPGITLHFEGGVDLELTDEQILSYETGSVVCLAFSVPPEDSNTTSIFGNYQQQNMHIVYDLPNSRLGFAAENCSA